MRLNGTGIVPVFGLPRPINFRRRRTQSARVKFFSVIITAWRVFGLGKEFSLERNPNCSACGGVLLCPLARTFDLDNPCVIFH